MNGQEGILKLDGPTVKRRLRVLRNGLRALNYDKVPDLLKTVLLKQKIVTESQFQNILSTWVPGSIAAGDFLLQRRILTPEMVKNEIRHQLQSVVLQILLSSDLKYEFTAEEDALDYELFTADDLTRELTFNSNALLMEAVRQDDDLRRFRSTITSGNEIFIPADRAALSAKNLEIAPGILKQIKPLLNGENTVDQLVASTTLSTFEVYQALYYLKEHGILKPLDIAGRKALAEKLRKSLRVTDAAEIYRSILVVDPADTETRLKLISILEKARDSEAEVIQHYMFLASSPGPQDLRQQVGYLQKALSISPSNTKVMEMLFHLYHKHGKQEEALGIARGLLAQAKSSSQRQPALDLLYKIINFYPQETFLFNELHEIHLASNNSEAALDCLKTLAEIYEHRKDFPRLRKTYEKIVHLRPSEDYKLRRVSYLERKARPRRRRPYTKMAACILVTIGLVASCLFAINEVFSRKLLAQITQEVAIQKKFGHLEKAKQALEDFNKAYPYAISIQATHREIAELTKQLQLKEQDTKQQLEKQRMQAETDLAKAKLAYQSNEYEKALKLLNAIDTRIMHEVTGSEAKSLRSTISRYFSEARELANLADVGERNKDYESAYRIRCKLLMNFPYSQVVDGLLLPIQVESTPPGADVLVDSAVMGRTPLLLKLSPVKIPQISLRKKGYETFSLNRDSIDGTIFNPLVSHVVAVPLAKTLEWKFDARGSIEGTPLVYGDTVCIATRNGDVFSLAQETSQPIWSFSVPGKMDCGGGLGIWNNVLYFGSFDGNIYVLEAQTGRPGLNPFPASLERYPIKHSLSRPNERGLVAANCDGRLLSCASLVNGELIWSIPFTTTRILGQPQALGRSLYVATTGGELLEIVHETGEIKRRVSLGESLIASGRILSGIYYIGTSSGKLLAVDLTQGAVTWSRNCDTQLTSAPTLDAEAIFVPGTNQLFCHTLSGNLKWKTKIPSPVNPEATGVVFKNTLYLGTTTAQILCLDVWTGRMMWVFSAHGKPEDNSRGVVSSGVVSKGRLFIGAEDGNLYCFLAD
jgi:outer membrane protein assembly factor BamB/tetratricopeptide (TPR) repeat protein